MGCAVAAGARRRVPGGNRRRRGHAVPAIGSTGAHGARAPARSPAAVCPAGRVRSRHPALRIRCQALRALCGERRHAGHPGRAGRVRPAPALVDRGAGHARRGAVAVRDARGHAPDQRGPLRDRRIPRAGTAARPTRPAASAIPPPATVSPPTRSTGPAHPPARSTSRTRPTRCRSRSAPPTASPRAIRSTCAAA